MILNAQHLDDLGKSINTPRPSPHVRLGRGWLQIGGRKRGSVKVKSGRSAFSMRWIIGVDVEYDALPPHAIDTLNELLWADLTSDKPHCKGVGIICDDGLQHVLGDVRILDNERINDKLCRLTFEACTYQVHRE